MSIEESDKTAIRQALHAINNSLHVLGLQAELARLQMSNGNLQAASTALEQVLRERNTCGSSTRALQSLIHSL
jgi:hypothetical protein